MTTSDLRELVESSAGEVAAMRARTSLPSLRRRGWLTRRLLLLADVAGLSLAFVLAEWIFGIGVSPAWWRHDRYGLGVETLVFVATLPPWLVFARLYGLYRQDEERMDHSTADDLVPVFHLVTMGVWLFMGAAWLTQLAQPEFPKMFTFWLAAIALVTVGRALARSFARRRPSFRQRVAVVGAGRVGQAVARTLLHHQEYGLDVVGFVDDFPGRDSPPLVAPFLGELERLPEVVKEQRVERVLIATAAADDDRVIGMLHRLKQLDVLIDIVPRYFQTIQPGLAIHAVAGIPVLGLPPARPARTSRWAKRALDVAVAATVLAFILPLFPLIALLIRRDSPGPIFFRQTRLGLDMRPFTMLKFRTMTVGVDPNRHREYIRQLMNADVAPTVGGMYKLVDRPEVTRIGRWLRRTSLDELPQLLNVLRGDMSLVGPRPCLAYEIENFEPHHFERFLVPPGLTGLWQVTSRARSTFREALELDVAYARGRSFGLDLRLLARTPLQIFTSRGAG